MFKKIFIDLCNQKKESPSAVCRKVGITPATFSGWTDKTIPRQATLSRIADYFGVTVEYLLRDDDSEQKESSSLTDERVKIAMEHINGLSKEELDVLIPLLEQMKKAKKGTD